MKLRLSLVTIGIAFICMVVISIITKKSLSNMNEMENPLEEYNVGIADDSARPLICDMVETLPSQPNILAVRCESNYEFLYKCAIQDVKVEKVFSGEGINVRDEISVLMSNHIYQDVKLLNMGYRNQMEVGKVYLVFLEDKIDVYNKKIYTFSDDYFIHPVFSYSSMKMEPLVSDFKDVNQVNYNKVEGIEFFFDNSKTIEAMRHTAEEMINTYCYEN